MRSRRARGSSARRRFSARARFRERAGADVVLKAENLQRTGSFKLRGALAKIASLGEALRGGVVCGSAGNHAQAVAYAARARGVPCEVFMPEAAPDRQGRGGDGARARRCELAGETVEESLAAARARGRGGAARSSTRSTTPT